MAEFFECKICGRSFLRLRSYKQDFCPSASTCNGRLDTNEMIAADVKQVLWEAQEREVNRVHIDGEEIFS